MNGELAQAAALVAFAKAHLAGQRVTLDRSHTTFRFVDSLRFDGAPTLADPGRLGVVASHPGDWFAYLEEIAVSAVDLVVGAGDPNTSVFAGGGSWAVRTVAGAREWLWVARWEVERRNDPHQRIWGVRYRAQPLDAPLVTHWDVETVASELRAALEEIRDFAADSELDSWCPHFEDALEALSSEQPTPGYYSDLLPEVGYGLPARRLLAAACGAWVFGGMGSWNDGGFADASQQSRYLCVTQDLYSAVLASVASAVNAFDDGASEPAGAPAPSRPDPPPRARALRKLALGGLGAVGAAWLFPSIVALEPKGTLPGKIWMVLALPGAYALTGLLELVTGRSFGELSAAWDALSGWQRALIGVGVVAASAVALFFGIALVIADP